MPAARIVDQLAGVSGSSHRQDGTAADSREWHLLQDLEITLRLKRGGVR